MPVAIKAPDLQQKLATANARLRAAREKLATAQAELAAAEAKVNSIVGPIHTKEQKRDELSKKQSCTTIRVWIPTPSWRHPFAGRHEDRTTCVPDTNAIAQAAALEVEIAGLYVALESARAGLGAAKAAVSAAEALVAAEQKVVDALQK